ncbi:MAG: chitobiase/beta-hexosaminidase C-terminal domain-containing protein [Paludibacteraceae bacterium]|nr:chitobiase/beta-hexosaminidase C-terminal domain-containing protein [Paludibacteraceae bacterium]
MKKTFLFLTALLMCGIGNVMAANKVVTLTAESGFSSKYEDKTFTVDEVEFASSGVMYNAKGTPSGYAAKQVMQLRKSGSGAGTITSSAVDGYNIASVAVYVQGTNVFSLAFDDADSVASSTLTPKTESVKYTTADSKEGSATANIYTFEPESEAAIFTIKNDTKANYFFKIVVTYETSQSTVTLDSLYIKGKAEKMEYEVGEAFDPAGLEVWGYYTKVMKHDSTSQIKSGITWTLDPETFEEASDNESVTLVASYKELTTADTTITGINVKAAVVKMDVAFDFTTNLYGHKGVSSGSGESYISDGDIAVGEKFNENPTQIEFTVNGGTQTRFWDASKKHELRMYNGATFVLSIAGDYKIIKVEFTGTDVALTGNNVTVSEKVWEGDAAKSITFKATATTKINSIKVTYIAAAPAVANPTATPSTMANVYWEPITVTLACATEGADIYYTIDGSEPTASATKYDAPFSVSATTTVKAIAMKQGLDNSEVVSKTFTFGTVFASLEELVEKQPAKDDVAYVQVTITNAEIDSFYVSSKGYTNGVFITVKNTAIELYTNDVPATWEAGGKVSGTIKAEWLLYKGTPELQKWEGGWDAFTYTKPSDPTALQQVMMNGNIRKAMHNGHIMILKGDKMFNLHGMLVK